MLVFRVLSGELIKSQLCPDWPSDQGLSVYSAGLMSEFLKHYSPKDHLDQVARPHLQSEDSN